MKHFSLLFFILLITVSAGYSQEKNSGKHGSVKIRKSGQLSKILFDDVNYRLIGMDRSGNILDSAVVSFNMSVTIKGIAYSESTPGPALSLQMRQLLVRCDRTTVIFFEEIKAKDKYGTIIDMPKFKHTFGYSDEDND